METYWIVEGGEEGGPTGGHAVYGLRQARAAVLELSVLVEAGPPVTAGRGVMPETLAPGSSEFRPH
jgi:hypothetical protein